VVEQEKVHGGEDGHVMMVIKLQLRKEERENKMAQSKCIFDRSILFWHSRHLVGVSVFRIDSHTIKRDETRLEMQLSKCH